MDVLVLGGSVFLGKAMVNEALAAGASVTVFNRGISGTAPAGVEQVIGDRSSEADLAQLDGRRFDLVLDTCGYVPAVVAKSASLLARSADHYVFVSTISVYPGWPGDADYRTQGPYDGDPNATTAPEQLVDGAPYGWLKVGCERAVEQAFGPRRTTTLRAGLIVGPSDSATGRLPWWIDRVARAAHDPEILVPGEPDAHVALIDSRDLARFALRAPAGTFETPGPPSRDTRADLMAACAAATGTQPTLTYVDEAWLVDQGVEGWTELPLWAPSQEAPSVFAHHPAEAVAAGLTWRPLSETVVDTWAWQRSQPDGWRPSERTPGLDPERERKLIAAWHGR
jgi:2'-hydroxyisoflavone reductase